MSSKNKRKKKSKRKKKQSAYAVKGAISVGKWFWIIFYFFIGVILIYMIAGLLKQL